MAQAGGSATINGILYQILGTLSVASTVHLRAARQGDDFRSAQLRIEPAGGGGDAQLLVGARRIVFQWKAKSDTGPWSLRKVITEVLPDLYIAVEDDHLADEVEYRFVTEGRTANTWAAAHQFLRDLSKGMPPADPLAVLNRRTKQQFFPDEACTPRAFFRQIVEAVRTRVAIRHESISVTARKLWHLLARFTLQERASLSAFRQQIDEYLLDFVDYAEDLENKRNDLCWRLLERGGCGDVTIVPQDLLQEVGLMAYSFRDWAGLQSRLQQQLTQRLHREHYDASLDVRHAPVWPQEFPIFLLTGESGQGKSWQLFTLAARLPQQIAL